MRRRGLALFALVAAAPLVRADPPAAAPPSTKPATRATTPGVGTLPHIAVDAKAKEVRVDCTAVKADYPLEFLAVATHANDYEAVVCSEAKPSDLHLALLMIGLTPGSPVHYVEATNTWLPPSGPAVDIAFEYRKDGKAVRVPAYRWMRDVKTKKEAAPIAWVFTGSKMLDDNRYGADMTNCMVGVINNPLSVVDVPALKSGALEARDYERNGDLVPATGTAVTMILSPAAPAAPPAAVTRPATQPSVSPHARVDRSQDGPLAVRIDRGTEASLGDQPWGLAEPSRRPGRPPGGRDLGVVDDVGPGGSRG